VPGALPDIFRQMLLESQLGLAALSLICFLYRLNLGDDPVPIEEDKDRGCLKRGSPQHDQFVDGSPRPYLGVFASVLIVEE
jgi:hypothetical protein